MSLSLIFASLWVLGASLMAMLPSKRNHWPAAYALVVAGIPLLGFITLQHGPWVGLACLGAGASVLRWPLIYLLRWLRRLPGGRNES